MIDPATLQALPRLLSAARFDRYTARYDGRTDLAARLYAWNSEIASAFWGPVGCLEVFVRNALHDELRRGRRDDWWNDSAVHLLDRERRAVDDATRTLRRRGFTDPEPDQVVAATSFGFWVGLTDAGIPETRSGATRRRSGSPGSCTRSPAWGRSDASSCTGDSMPCGDSGTGSPTTNRSTMRRCRPSATTSSRSPERSTPTQQRSSPVRTVSTTSWIGSEWRCRQAPR